MELLLQRQHSGRHATLGILTVDGAEACFTVEDVVREPREVNGGHKTPVERWKVHGQTAIPQGRYRVTITYSGRFKRDLPLVNAVPGFEGIRIHPGNTHADTEGCILPGTRIVGEQVVESRAAFNRLMLAIESALDAGEEVWLEIRNAPGWKPVERALA